MYLKKYFLTHKIIGRIFITLKKLKSIHRHNTVLIYSVIYCNVLCDTQFNFVHDCILIRYLIYEAIFPELNTISSNLVSYYSILPCNYSLIIITYITWRFYLVIFQIVFDTNIVHMSLFSPNSYAYAPWLTSGFLRQRFFAHTAERIF